MKTRYTFIVTGNIVYNGDKQTMSFKVKSTTCINRIIRILCESINKDVSQIKSCSIWCQYMTWSERCYININDTNITFRDLSIVGKKSITLTVDLDNFF
jgi:hypothetical protein